jgi:hypothetical protein
MATWKLDEPGRTTFDQVRRLAVRIVEGGVSVVGGDDRPTLEVPELVATTTSGHIALLRRAPEATP